MGLLIVTSVAFFGLLLWLMDGWMTGHALVASKNGKWEIVSQGWWMLLSLGGPLGAFAFLIGLISNIPAWSRLLGFLEEKQDAEIEQTRASLISERQKLEASKAALDQKIRQAAAQGRQDGARIAQEASEAQAKAESLARAYENRLRALEGRLKGAQQKATRFKKTALLMKG